MTYPLEMPSSCKVSFLPCYVTKLISFFVFFFSFVSPGAAAVKSGAGSPLRGGPGAGQQPVQVLIKDSPIILAQVT